MHAVSSGYSRVVAIDVRDSKVTGVFRIDLPSWTIGAMNAALSPDGGRIAIANGEEDDRGRLLARRLDALEALVTRRVSSLPVR